MTLLASNPPLSNALSLIGMAAGLSLLVVVLFRLRVRLGLAPLYLTVGVFQHMQVMLANTLYLEVLPGIFMSPGSVVMFSLAFFAILLVYISDGAGEARKMCYGLLAANLCMAGISLFLGTIAGRDGVTILYQLPASFFSQDFRIMAVGTIALVIDIVLLIVVYEYSSKIFQNSVFLRLASTMAVILALDTLLFTTGAFYGKENYVALLVSGLVGKVGIALFYSLALTLYFHTWEPKTSEKIATADGGRDWQDVFHLLTFRQKYGVLKQLNSDLQESRDELAAALANVELLSGILPICSFCKDIRDSEGAWRRIDQFIQDHSDTRFSHSICPNCAEREYPDHLDETDFDGEIST